MSLSYPDREAIRGFLEAQYHSPVEMLETHDGEFSQAYIFDVQQQHRIIRINPSSTGFMKDQFIAATYPRIPTAQVMEIGTLPTGSSYCISEALMGTQLHRLDDHENTQLFSELFELMNRIHFSEIKQSGYGEWDMRTQLKGKYDHWHEKLRSIFEEDQWQSLNEKVNFFDLRLFYRLKKEFEKLENLIPNIRHLLHGDFGRTNILAHNGKITGVIDWSESMYGDPLYDLAWIAFWPDKIPYVQQYYEHNKAEPTINLRYYNERLLAYFLVIGIHSLVFMAKRKRETEYEEVINALSRQTELTL